MGIKPIIRVKIGEQVYNQLKELILSNEWAPGEKIPSENELAEMFGVSRITIRQALQKLVVLDLLETRVGEGSFVKTVDLVDSMNMNALIPTVYLGDNSAMEIFEFREIIETQCAYLAALRANEEDIQELEEILDRMVIYEKIRDIENLSKVDMEFHFKIAEITRNKIIIKTMTILRDVLERAIQETIHETGLNNNVNGIRYHSKILAEIKRHDPKMAKRIMREHICSTSELLEVKNKKS